MVISSRYRQFCLVNPYRFGIDLFYCIGINDKGSVYFNKRVLQ